MKGWISRLLSRGQDRDPVVGADASTDPLQPIDEPAPVEMATEPAPLAAAVEPTAENARIDPLPWLLNSGPLTHTELSAPEAAALAAVDQIRALPIVPDNLLPRAAALIPQLIALVRQTDLPVPAIAARVGKDPVLAAELMRLARSPYYRVQGQVADLEQAISLIGLQGLQTVIARVLLKPIYQSAPGPLSGRVSARMWEHSEALARHTAILAEPAGQAIFDGYLVGMLHDTGWTVALTVIDRANIALTLPPSAAFASALEDRVHRLFGHAAQRWHITREFTALAQDARRNGPASDSHPLAKVLRDAHRRCMAELSAGDAGPAALRGYHRPAVARAPRRGHTAM